MARPRRPLLHAHLYPSFGRLSVRSRRRRGLDRAAFLQRRRDAEPSPDPAIFGFIRGREGMALERHALSAHRARLARQFRFPSRRDRDMLGEVYGNDTALWMRRWRWLLLATAGLFGYADGSEWGVSHYRMKAAQ